LFLNHVIASNCRGQATLSHSQFPLSAFSCFLQIYSHHSGLSIIPYVTRFHITRKEASLNLQTESSSSHNDFAATEIRAAQLLRQGKIMSKNSAILDLSPVTVIMRRKNIRKNSVSLIPGKT